MTRYVVILECGHARLESLPVPSRLEAERFAERLKARLTRKDRKHGPAEPSGVAVFVEAVPK